MKNRMWVLLLSFVLLLAACGNEQGGGGTVAITPIDASAEAAEGKTAVSSPILPDLSGLEDDEKAVQILLGETAVSEFLSNHDGWISDVWQEDDNSTLWTVEFYDANEEEWLGWGEVDVQSSTILDFYVPRELSPEEFQTGMVQVEKLVLNDAGVQARLGDPDLWEHDTEYDSESEAWTVEFWHGLDALEAIVYLDEDGAYLEEIVNPNQLEAEEQAAYERDLAVELSWEADGIDAALDGVDNWHTLVSPQGELWAVSYIANDEELFFALVDIDAELIIDSK